jgi:hypothetical protein
VRRLQVRLHHRRPLVIRRFRQRTGPRPRAGDDRDPVDARERFRGLGEKRAGDPAVLIAASGKIKSELGWEPEFQDLEIIIESAWKWLRNHLQKSAVSSNSKSR